MQAISKLCLTCRDEVKKLNREKTQLADRLKEAESAQLRLDTEVNSLRSSAATSTERHDAVFADTERKLHQAQELARTKQEEASKSLVPCCIASLHKGNLCLLCRCQCCTPVMHLQCK